LLTLDVAAKMLTMAAKQTNLINLKLLLVAAAIVGNMAAKIKLLHQLTL